MKNNLWMIAGILLLALSGTSCVTNKVHDSLKAELELANQQLGECGENLSRYMNQLGECESQLRTARSNAQLRDEQIADLRSQIEDLRRMRDQQSTQVEGLTTISQSANENIQRTLQQLETKDKYIRFLQLAKTRADSINLALAVNLKSVLREGIEDDDVEVKVDKTVVFINLSDKMLFQSGSAKITPRADEVLSKIAAIVQSRPGVEVMVEGYTDNVPIRTNCLEDNWDLSVMRSTAVVRALQLQHGVDPNRLIAAGRGEYNALQPNTTTEGRAANRRTRIIILPKLDQFYDLLNPDNVPE